MMFRRCITNTQLLFFFFTRLQHAVSHGGLYKGVNGQWQLGLTDSMIIWWRGGTGAVLRGQLANTGSYWERRKPLGGMIARTLFNRYVDAECSFWIAVDSTDSRRYFYLNTNVSGRRVTNRDVCRKWSIWQRSQVMLWGSISLLFWKGLEIASRASMGLYLISYLKTTV